VNFVDRNGSYIETPAEIALILYDVTDLTIGYIKNGKVDPIDAAALSADAAGLLIPGGGAGLVVRGGAAAGKAADVGRVASNTADGLSDVKKIDNAVGLANKAETIVGQPITITNRQLKNHVIYRHGPYSKFDYASKFNNTDDIRTLVHNAEHLPAQLQPNGKYLRIADAGRNIGMDRLTKQQTSIYTVITDKNGKLITTYPGRP